MKLLPLAVDGAWQVTPTLHGDNRGTFLEWYRADVLASAVGRPLVPAQANISVSARGVVRGIHFAAVPPGQAKYVTCVRGAVLDVAVDLRVGSPTFGVVETVRLDDLDRRAVYLPVGVGHGFCALTDDATVLYLTSSPYDPASEHAVHCLDPALDIEWPVDQAVLSERDRAAPTLAEVRARGLLPSFADCR